MCQLCLDSLKEVFPEVPETERADFLMGTTCFPFGDGEDTRAQLLDNRRRMTTADYRECYAIADRDMDEAMEGWRDDVVEPTPGLTNGD